MASPPLSSQVYAILTALVEERTGLAFDAADAAIFADKLATRMEEAGFARPLDYYYALRYDDPEGRELAALIDTLVVGETYFFRELEPLAAAIEHVIRPAVDARGSARIWSAACSTGEEAYSLAMLLDDAGLLDAVAIDATDISTRALEKARSGVYGARSMRVVQGSMPAPMPDVARRLAARHVTSEDGRFRVSPSLAAHITFDRVNLTDRAAVASRGPFDLIVCRNVLIYFADETVRGVADSLARCLTDDGRLLVGASESLMRFGTLLACEEKSRAFLYRKAS